MTTQKDIAAELGIDVSSVNKILSKNKGGKFKDETIARVFRTAKRMRYDFAKPSKGRLLEILRELFPESSGEGILAVQRGLPIEKVREIRALIEKAGGAAVVLFVLRFLIGLS